MIQVRVVLRILINQRSSTRGLQLLPDEKKKKKTDKPDAVSEM
jgi:hypothetical protein